MDCPTELDILMSDPKNREKVSKLSAMLLNGKRDYSCDQDDLHQSAEEHERRLAKIKDATNIKSTLDGTAAQFREYIDKLRQALFSDEDCSNRDNILQVMHPDVGVKIALATESYSPGTMQREHTRLRMTNALQFGAENLRLCGYNKKAEKYEQYYHKRPE